MTILVTGFEPFAGAPVNPSGDAVRAIAAQTAEQDVVTAILPVTFADAAPELLRLAELHRPDAVIATGVAEGRRGITVEQLAANLDHAPLPDNRGDQPRHVRIEADAPDGLFTSLPAHEIVAALTSHGVEASVSMTAGTYVCNHVFFSLMWALRDTSVPRGFIHVPATPEMRLADDIPTMPLEEISGGLSIALAVVRDTLTKEAQ